MPARLPRSGSNATRLYQNAFHIQGGYPCLPCLPGRMTAWHGIYGQVFQNAGTWPVVDCARNSLLVGLPSHPWWRKPTPAWLQVSWVGRMPIHANQLTGCPSLPSHRANRLGSSYRTANDWDRTNRLNITKRLGHVTEPTADITEEQTQLKQVLMYIKHRGIAHLSSYFTRPGSGSRAPRQREGGIKRSKGE